MKTLKRLLTVVLAFVMSLTVAVFSACNFTSGNNGDNGDKGNNGENGDNGGNGGDVTAEYVGSTEEITALVNAMLIQVTPQVGINFGMQELEKQEQFNVDGAGNKISDTNQRTETYTMDAAMNGKFNLLSGDADLVMTDKHKVPTTYDNYEYAFLRDWNMFSYSEEHERDEDDNKIGSNEVKDFTGKTLYWGGDMYDQMAEAGADAAIKQIFGDDFDMGEIASKLVMPEYGAMIAALADSLGAFKIEGNTATADINLAIYNLVGKLKTVLDQLKGSTTIGEFLALNEIKTVIGALTTGLTGEQAAQYVQSALATLGIVGLSIPADKDSTVYDYIIKVLSSDELYAFVNAMLTGMGSPVTLPSKLNALTLDFVLSIYNAAKGLTGDAALSIDKIKAAFNKYTSGIKEDELVYNEESATTDAEIGDFHGYGLDEDVTKNVPVNSYQRFSLKNLKLVYTLDNNKVTGQSVSFAVKEQSKNAGINAGLDYMEKLSLVSNPELLDKWLAEFEPEVISVYTYAMDMNISVSVEYPATEYTLKNIDNNEIIYDKYEWVDGTKYEAGAYIRSEEIKHMIDGLPEERNVYIDWNDYKVAANVNGGKLVGVNLYEDGNSVGVLKNNTKVAFKGVAEWYDDEKQQNETKPVSIELYAKVEESDYGVRVHFYQAPIAEEKPSEGPSFPWGGGSVNKSGIVEASMSKSTVYYKNTVKGILAGGHASSTKFDPTADL